MEKILIFIVLIISSTLVFADEHWTGEIKWINVDENGSSYIFIDNPRSPNGAGSSNFNCGETNIVYLGKKNLPTNNALLSQALMVYSSNKTIRFGVRRVGGYCETFYISAR